MGVSWKHILSFFTRSKPGAGTVEVSGQERADHLLKDLVLNKQVPGLAIQVLYKGEEWFCQGYGFANITEEIPVIPSSAVFRVGSISKPITAMALASMVQEGLVDLQDDIRKYVPEFPQCHGPVSLKQLASHTAGIRSYKGKEFALNQPMSIQDSLVLFVRDPLEFSPGKGYQYTSFDYVLLSLAMERAAGKPFGTLVCERVLKPLQMQRTVAEIPGKPVENQVAFYTKRGSGFRESVPVDTRFKLAGGGYLSTVSDICTLGLASLEGQIVTRELSSDFLKAVEIDGTSTFYGLGWEVSRDSKGRPFYGHTGNAIGAYTNFKVFPEQELVVAILISASTAQVQPILDAVVEALQESLCESRG